MRIFFFHRKIANLFPLWKPCTNAIVLFMAACMGFTGCKKEGAVDLPPPIVTVSKAVDKEVQDWDDYTGRLAPMGTVEIRPRVSGYITEVKFSDGDLVKKGQSLFIIDPRPYQAEYDKAKGDSDKAESALKLANLEFDRAKQLRDKGVTAATDFDQKAAAQQQAAGHALAARSVLESAKLNLEFCTIISPIDGRASLANITVGNLVSPSNSQPLTTIVSTNPVYAYADIDERSLLRYVRYYKAKQAPLENVEEVKMPIYLSLQDEKGFPHKGYIDFMDNRVDPTTGTISVRGVFDFEGGLLGPGLFVRVRIPAGDPYKAIVIPQRAVAADQGKKFVMIVDKDNVATYRPVELGTTAEGMTVIKDGVKVGETVVVDGILKIRPGEKVNPKPMEATSAAESSPSPSASAASK